MIPTYQRVAKNIMQSHPGLQQQQATPVEALPVSRWASDFSKGLYIHRDSHTIYRPHHRDEHDFVVGDAPRRWLVKGGEGCVGAETLIEGTPVADWAGGTVKTLYGPATASKVYLKGQADLYRVRTVSGREVVVTLEHRFLTPTGWHQLQDLVVGTLIAAHDTEHGQPDIERPIGSRDRCLDGSHPYDELPTPRASDVLDRLRPPAMIHAASWPDRALLSVQGNDRPYRTHSWGHEGVSQFDYRDGQHQHGPNVVVQLHTPSPLDLRYLDRRDLDCIEQRLLQLISQSLPVHEAVGALPSPLDGIEYSTGLLQTAQQWPGTTVPTGTTTVFCPCLPEGATFPFEDASDNKLMTSSHYKAFWDEIQQITYERHDNYYDLSVPGVEHYEAGGLWHHNSGKSVCGIVKDLERLRRGMSGIMGSPTLVHFKKSLWPEFKRWCPRNAVIREHRYRLNVEFQPNQPFELVFTSGATLLCGGFDSPGSWEGPNVNFAHVDEGRHLASPAMAKVLDGRCRIAGPDGEPPQWWITTTPRKSKLSTSPDEAKYHWLYEMFGPWEDDGEDPFESFKRESRVTTLHLRDNAANLAEGFVEQRVQSLTAKETRILADAEWEDEDDTERFLPSMVLWDSLAAPLPPLGREPLVIALDAATGRKSTVSDCFGLVAVTPASYMRAGAKGSAVRYVEKWQARAGGHIEYSTPMLDGPGDRLRWLIDHHNVTCVTFDPHQLVFVAQALEQEGRVWVEPYNQGSDRLVSDRHLYDQVIQKEVLHDGNEDLRAHIDNADRKVDSDKHNFRLIQGRGKIDLAVCLSMADKQLSELNL